MESEFSNVNNALRADFDKVATDMCNATLQIAYEVGGEELLRTIYEQGISYDRLPKVEILTHLNDLSPGAAERIMTRAEQLQAERLARDTAERESIKGRIALWTKAGSQAIDIMSRAFGDPAPRKRH